MIRLGSNPPDMHEMFIDDIFLVRLKLLIIMAKAYLHDYPLGRYRCNAITSNAQIMKDDAVDLGNLSEPGASHFTTETISDSEKNFYESVKTLAETALEFASGSEIGMSKRKKLDLVLLGLCENIPFDGGLKNREFLKVA
jgi:hypothetical protein